MDGKYKIHPVVFVIVLLFVVLVGTLLWMNKGAGSIQLIQSTTYSCSEGKIIQAAFYPTQVRLILNDGKKMTLQQAVSGSGIRYSNSDGSFVFWSKGNTAYVLEGNPAVETYSDCVTSGDIPVKQQSWNTYSKPLSHFSISYPPGYIVNAAYSYTELGPGNFIDGVKFAVPPASVTNTNLSSDSGVSIEEISNPASCTAARFLSQPKNVRTVSEEGIDYSVADASDAGAGNFYEERVYAIPGTQPCLAVRYFLHSTNIDNYPPGTVQEFDRAALIAAFDKIRTTLTITK